MFDHKPFWLFSRILVLSIWIVLAITSVVHVGYITLVARFAFLILLLIHLTVLPISLTIGNERNLSKSRIVLKSLIFGFTWWVPLRKGIIHE